MSAAALGSRFMLGERPEPGYVRSFALAFAVHALLLAILFLGVRVQSHAPQTVSVELWEPPPRAAEPSRPLPQVEPEPPKPEPKIEKPEIVEKALAKPKPKPEPKAEPKPKPVAQKDDREFKRRIQEELAREQAASQERQMKDLAAREQVAARDRALAAWTDRIRAKVRSNIIMPPDMKGNPEAIFDVNLLPSGDVLNKRLKKSSGFPAYDVAVERAIEKSTPFPKPEPQSLFRRDLELKFRPLDQ